MTSVSEDYALVTPARNEMAYLGTTIESVLAQTIRPVRWVIVDDGSVDQTTAIASAYSERCPWITVIRRDDMPSRDFASKARAFALGRERLNGVAYAYLGNLDADISLPPDYYERVLASFQGNRMLGIAGGRSYDLGDDGRRYPVVTSTDSVRGAVQLFRRECYEEVGGYLALPLGGIDSAAEIMARMKGWEVRTLPQLSVLHLRPTGSGMRSPLSALVRRGFQDRSLGYHWLFEFVRCCARLMERPRIIGGLGVLSGYMWSWLRGRRPALPQDVVEYLHREQRRKLSPRLQIAGL